MNLINKYADKILKHLHSQFPRLSEIMMFEIIDNIGDEGQFDAFVGAMEYLAGEGYLSYRNSIYGRQLYAMVTLTEKGLSVLEGRALFRKFRYR